jgi:O-acetyl-ADP-ribose deacetylase (regulator of RNase III)
MTMGHVLHKTGNLFTSTAPVYIHGVNVEGKMDIGFNLTLKQKYPSVFRDYKLACDISLFHPGEFLFLTAENGQQVYSVAMQNKAGTRANFEWLQSGLTKAIEHAEKAGIKTVALPLIGTGLGGLELDLVCAAIQKIASSHNVNVEMWTL